MNDHPLASRWQRLGGYLLDLLVMGIILILIMSLTGTVEQIRSEEALSIGQRLVWAAIGWALFLALNGYLLARHGQTIGKQLVGTRIVDLEGVVLPFGKLIFLRYGIIPLVSQIPILGPIIALLDSLWIFGREKRCLHDVLAGTKVVTVESGLTPVARRILQGTGLVAVILVGLLIYRKSLIATGQRLEPGNYQLAFVKSKPRGGDDVYVLDVEQGAVTQMTMNHKVFGMMWTPDGQEMMLRVGSNRALYLLNASTGKAKQLNRDPEMSRLFGWSPDGQQHAFSAQYEDDVDPEIYLAKADGTEKRRLVQNPGSDNGPAWSPDGQHLAFWTRQEESWTLSVVNSDGTNLKRIAQQPVPFAPISALFWAPDGSKLLFVSPTELHPQWGGVIAAHVFIIDANGQNLIDAGDTTWQIARPNWSPDGNMIAFDGTFSACLFSLHDGKLDCQYGREYERESPTWSPDGRYLAYVQRTWFSELKGICVREITTGRERCFEETTAGGNSLLWRP